MFLVGQEKGTEFSEARYKQWVKAGGTIKVCLFAAFQLAYWVSDFASFTRFVLLVRQTYSPFSIPSRFIRILSIPIILLCFVICAWRRGPIWVCF